MNRTDDLPVTQYFMFYSQFGSPAVGDFWFQPSGNAIRIYSVDGGGAGFRIAGNLPLNEYQHFVVTYNATSMEIFTNGNLNITEDLDGGWNFNSRTLPLFSNDNGPTDYTSITNINFDEIGIWNRTLSDAEITQLYNAGAGITPPEIPTTPIVTIVYPTATSYSSTQIELNYTFNLGVGSIDSCWYSLNLGVTNSTRQNCGVNWTGLTSSEGSNTWTVYANATTGEMGNTTVTFTINTSPIIVIAYPKSEIYIASTLDLNYSASTGATLDSCWYSLDGGTTNSTRQNCNTNWTGLTATDGSNTWIVYGNTTDGILGSNYTTFNSSTFVENSITYNSSVQEMSYQGFTLNATINAAYTLNAAKLIYNNTQYTSTISSSGSNRLITNSIEIPSVDITQNKSFYWNLTFTDGASNLHYYDTSTSNQTVSSIFLGLCNSTYNMTTLNFSTKDEEDSHLLNNTIHINLNYYPSIGTGSITKSFVYQNLSETTPYRSLCIYPENSELKITGVVSYKSTGYDTRSYYFDNVNINNISQDIDLYLALIANSDIVTFAVVDDYDRSVEGATIVIEKWDIGTDSYLIVNTINTDSEGKSSSNLILYETYYRFKVYYDGILYLTDGPAIVSTTTKNFKIYFEQQLDYSPFGNVVHSLVYNSSNNQTSFTWGGDNVNITQGCLTIKNITDPWDEKIIYDNCFSTAIGEISVIVNSPGTYNAYGTISILDENENILSNVVDSIIFSNNKPERYEIIQTYGQAASFLIIGTVAVIGVAAGSIPLGFGLVTISLFLINWIGFLDLRAILWSLVSLIIVMIVVSIRRKR